MYTREQDAKDLFGTVVEDGDIIAFATSIGHSGALRIAVVLDAKEGKVRSLMKSFYSPDKPRLADRNAKIVSFNKSFVIGYELLPADARAALFNFYEEYVNEQEKVSSVGGTSPVAV